MELLPNIEALDLFIYLKKHKVLVLSDLHIGYEESLIRKGILVPKNNFKELMLRLEKILEKLPYLNKIVINGDLVHEFGKITIDEKFQIKELVKFLEKYSSVLIIEGNHDKILPYVSNLNLEIVKKLVVEDILIIHGDKIEKDLKGIKTIIIGHEHPAISLTKGARSEKYKCFLKGKYDKQDLIVTPSCNLFLEGTDVLQEKLLSPYLKENNILNFESYVVEDQIYDFGTLKKLKQLNEK